MEHRDLQLLQPRFREDINLTSLLTTFTYIICFLLAGWEITRTILTPVFNTVPCDRSIGLVTDIQVTLGSFCRAVVENHTCTL